MESRARQHERFMVRNNAYVSLGGGFIKVGTMKDISLGGTSFEYIMYDDTLNEASRREKIDIFISRKGFHLTDVPCDIVYDIPVNTMSVSPLFARNFICRRCGVKFKELTEEHEEKIISFLENHTAGIVGAEKQ